MVEVRKRTLLESGARLIHHLDYVLDEDLGYPDPPSWGYAFTFLASEYFNSESSFSLSQKALKHLILQDKDSPNYSWEFVVYALQVSKKKTSFEIPKDLDCYREKGTRMFNWFLLRVLNKKLCNEFGFIERIKLWIASKFYQESSGLIVDEFKTRSLQYHAFCLFLLAELLQFDLKIDWLKEWFIKGVKFSLENVLLDGTAIYIGRGQEQIFGYGALLYALEFCHKRVEKLDELVLERVSSKLLSFQRKNGSFPLVLRNREPEIEFASFSKDNPPGWYGYNTLYDYQPFLAYCLLKAGNLK